jgi:hypothetical protein
MGFTVHVPLHLHTKKWTHQAPSHDLTPPNKTRHSFTYSFNFHIRANEWKAKNVQTNRPIHYAYKPPYTGYGYLTLIKIQSKTKLELRKIKVPRRKFFKNPLKFNSITWSSMRDTQLVVGLYLQTTRCV